MIRKISRTSSQAFGPEALTRFPAKPDDVDVRIVCGRNHTKFNLVFFLEIEHNQQYSYDAPSPVRVGANLAKIEINFPGTGLSKHFWAERIFNAETLGNVKYGIMLP